MVTLLNNSFGEKPEVCTMACCQHHKQPTKIPLKKLPFGCCNNDMTNPFAQCCCCSGFIPQHQNIEIGTLSTKTIVIYPTTEDLIPNYYSDYWRPPEIIG